VGWLIRAVPRRVLISVLRDRAFVVARFVHALLAVGLGLGVTVFGGPAWVIPAGIGLIAAGAILFRVGLSIGMWSAYYPSMATGSVTTVDKSAVLPGLFAVWDSLDGLLDGLPEEDWQAATPLPGWCVKAVVSHIIGTESFLEGVGPPEPDVDVKALD